MREGEGEGPLVFSQEQALHFSKIALKCIQREYPNQSAHVLNSNEDLQYPKSLHPAFYGCFDWHSSVHGHWMLVHLLRLFPQLSNRDVIHGLLNERLLAENLVTEAAYFNHPNRSSFERTYGWAWLLKLAEELYYWDDPQARTWYENLQPLTKVIVEKYFNFLSRQEYPIRSGTHTNSAFGLAFALDYARAVGNKDFDIALSKKSKEYYLQDKNYPVDWEPSGEDFFSPCLMEADLMRRILVPTEFKNWFHSFLPGISCGKPKSILAPVKVSDRKDPRLVHLDGLNLSRAWCMKSIAEALSPEDPVRNLLIEAARRHMEESFPFVAIGNYEGEHWLATFAVLYCFP